MVREGLQMTSAEQATVRKRLLIGLGIAAVMAAFAIVPTESLNGKASKPVFYYLVPVLRSVVRFLQRYDNHSMVMPTMPHAWRDVMFWRSNSLFCALCCQVCRCCMPVRQLVCACLAIMYTHASIVQQCMCTQDLLDDVAEDIEAGSLSSVPAAVKSILDKPNQARNNMYSAIEYLDRGRQQSARELVGVHFWHAKLCIDYIIRDPLIAFCLSNLLTLSTDIMYSVVNDSSVRQGSC